MQRFLTRHGSPNYGHSGICALQTAFGNAYTLGSPMLMPDYARTDLIIIWGANPAYSSCNGHDQFTGGPEKEGPN